MNSLLLVIGIVNDLRFTLFLSKEPKSEHGINIFPFFSCDHEDQFIMTVVYQSRVPVVSFPVLRLIDETLPSSSFTQGVEQGGRDPF